MLPSIIGHGRGFRDAIGNHVSVDRAAAARADQLKSLVTRVADGSSGRDPSFDQAKTTTGGRPIFAMKRGRYLGLNAVVREVIWHQHQAD